MRKLYNKSELGFALGWVALYIVLFSVADGLSAQLGVEKCITAPVGLALTAFLLVWLKKQGLYAVYGLCRPQGSLRTYLYFVPLAVLASVNFWGGAALHFSAVESALYFISMLCVGFLEEVIFRGFLFVRLAKDNLKSAFLVSSLTFGIGHIINLLSGAPLLATLLQVVYATAAGFLFTAIFYRSKSLLPCIVTHSVLNACSTFGAVRSPLGDALSAVALTVVSLLYAGWILWRIAGKNKTDCSIKVK